MSALHHTRSKFLAPFVRGYLVYIEILACITLGILIGIGIEAVSAGKQVTAAIHQFAIEHRHV